MIRSIIIINNLKKIKEDIKKLIINNEYSKNKDLIDFGLR